MAPLTPEQIEHLINTVLSGPTVEKASALFELIKAVADPEGDQDRYECALKALRTTDPLTKEYESWFQGRVRVPAAGNASHRTPA